MLHGIEYTISSFVYGRIGSKVKEQKTVMHVLCNFTIGRMWSTPPLPSFEWSRVYTQERKRLFSPRAQPLHRENGSASEKEERGCREKAINHFVTSPSTERLAPWQDEAKSDAEAWQRSHKGFPLIWLNERTGQKKEKSSRSQRHHSSHDVTRWCRSL